MATRSTKGPSREQRADETTLAALEIIGREQSATAAKTSRLRAQRLARDAENPTPPAKASKKPPRRA
jgi:hypothetical protein